MAGRQDIQVREELQGEKLRGKAGIRVLGYEERLREGKENRSARLCWEEVRKRTDMKEPGSRWEEERREYSEDKGIEKKNIEEGRKGERDWFKRPISIEKERQRIERWEKIKDTEYNKWYKWIKGHEIQRI